MCRKLICSIPVLLVLFFASTTQAAIPVDLNTGLVAWWTFDEGAGTIAMDGSGNGNNATLMSGATWTSDPNVAPGKGGHAILLNGTSAFLRVEHGPSLNLSNAITIEMWLYFNWIPATAGATLPAKGVLVKGTAGDGNAWKNLGIRTDDDPVTLRELNWRSRGGDTVNALNSGKGLPERQWTHIAITFDVNAPGNNQKIYTNGKLTAENRSTNPLTTNAGPIFIGAETYTQPAGRWWFQGMIDEGSLYNRALNALEIKTIAGVKPSTDPTPKNGATVSTTSVLLEWWQGANVAYTNGHHVYFGTSLADVNTGTSGTDKGFRTDPNYLMSGLVPGTIYYWRVDEVNNVHPDKLWKGEVWSFTVAAGKAAVPNPYDGALYVGRTRTLSWAAGTGAVSHHVYFGIDRIKVAAGAADVDKDATTQTSFNPGALTYDSTYYWRVDEFDGITTQTGDVWSFVTTASADPNLVGWWTFDTTGLGSLPVLDISGNENHGRFINDANIVTSSTRPYIGATGVLNLNGADECVYVPYNTTLDINTAGTVSMWVYGGAGNDAPIRHGGWNASYSFRLNNAATRYLQFRTTGAAPGFQTTTGIPTNQWTHIALTFDYRVLAPTTNQKIYLNGVLNVESQTATPLVRNLYYVAIGGRENATAMWGGMIDDVRIYNRALTASEVQVVMTGDPNLASNPNPDAGSIPDEEDSTPLSWTPGSHAAQHDVYFGTDAGAVQNATPLEPLGVYRFRQSAATYTPPFALEWGKTYYWRIDEVNDLHLKSPWKGGVWSFTVANYLIVDEFESYNNISPNRVFQTWLDGTGYSADEFFPVAYNGNGTGAAVGHDIWTPGTTYTNIMETAIRHGGAQSMPLYYNNTKSPYYSETERTFATSQNWTGHGIKELSLYFYGDPNNNTNEPMWVKLTDQSGNSGKIIYGKYADESLFNLMSATWYEWNIALADFGVNLTQVKKISIGFGDPAGTSPKTSGRVFFDDILLYLPRCLPSRLKSTGDLNNDCMVDYLDVDILANAWLLADQIINTTAPAATGLVGYWKLDDGTGTTAVDSSGNSYNGTLTGTPTWVAGHINGALQFNGTNDYVQIPTFSLNSNTVTMTAWVKRAGDQPSGAAILFYRDTGNTTPCGIGFSMVAGSTNLLRYHWNNNSAATYNWVSGLNVPNDEWFFVALVVEPTRATLYLNGSSATNTIAHVTQSIPEINLGWDSYAASRRFRGVLDDARVYNRALSQAEIAYLADTTPNDGKLHLSVQSAAELYSAEPDGSQKINFKDFAALAATWLEERLWP